MCSACSSRITSRETPNPKQRPLPWLMRAIEELYDSRYAKDTADLRGVYSRMCHCCHVCVCTLLGYCFWNTFHNYSIFTCFKIFLGRKQCAHVHALQGLAMLRARVTPARSPCWAHVYLSLLAAAPVLFAHAIFTLVTNCRLFTTP